MAIVNQVILGPSAPSSDEYVRPSNWLARPAIATGEKVIYLLCRVDSSGNNWLGFTCKGNYNVDYGYGNADVNSGVAFTLNLDYSQLTDWWDETETDKQVRIKITPQSGQNLNYFVTKDINYSNYDDFGYKYNTGVVEVLVGKLDTVADNSGVKFNWLINTKCIKIYERIVCSSGLYTPYYKCFKLECIEGEMESSDIRDVFIECFNLTYTADFQMIGAGGNNIIDSKTSIKVLNWPDFTAIYYVSVGAGEQIQSVTYKKALYLYNLAVNCFHLEEFLLTDDDGSYCVSCYNAFQNCGFIETPTLNLINSTNNSDMFKYNLRLIKSNLSNIKASISFYSCNLDHAAIYEIFDEQLQSVGSTQTIDLRLNPDIANLPVATIAIATAKNWTTQIS